MIVIDGPEQTTGAAVDGAIDETGIILVEDLVAACAAEAGRIAQAAERLDAAMGVLLSHLVGRTQGSAAADTPVRSLARELQETDRLRQEVSGLARALDLAVAAHGLSAPLTVPQVRACTPLRQLQDRLLSARGTDLPPEDAIW